MRKIMVIFLLGMAVGGCISVSRTLPELTSYALSVERKPVEAKSARTKVILIQRFNISPRFERSNLVYRTEEYTFEQDYYHRFLTAPALLITEQTKKWLSASEYVTVISGEGEVDYSLEGEIFELYGDFRDKKNPQAVMVLQFTLFDERSSQRKVAFQKIYRKRIPLIEVSVTELIKGFNRGFTEILHTFEEDIIAVE